MAVAVTGSNYSAEQQYNTVDQTISITTVPSDSKACIVVLSGYTAGTGCDFDQLNWNGDNADIDFTQIGTTTALIETSVFMMLDTDGTYPTKGSSATLYYSLDANTSEGALVGVFFLSGVDTTSALIGDDQEQSEVSWTSSSLGTVGANDMGFIAVGSYPGTPDTDILGQTEFYTDGPYRNVTLHIAYELNEDQLGWSGAGNYASGIAFAIAAAAAAAPTVLTISDITATTHIEALSLEQEHNLSLSDILVTTHIETFSLSQELTLSLSDILSTTHIEALSLIQEYELSVSGIDATTHISEITLQVLAVDTLTVADITTATHIESPSLIQEYELTISGIDATTHISEITLSVVVAGIETLTVSDITATTHIESFSLSQEHSLSLSDILSTTHIESAALTVEHVLIISDILVQTHIEAPSLTYGQIITPEAITAATHIETITLIQEYYLSIYGIAQPNYIESPTLTYTGAVYLGEVLNPYLATTTARSLKSSTTAREIKAA